MNLCSCLLFPGCLPGIHLASSTGQVVTLHRVVDVCLDSSGQSALLELMLLVKDTMSLLSYIVCVGWITRGAATTKRLPQGDMAAERGWW